MVRPMDPVNVSDYEARAREAISGPILDYYDGGANDEVTRDNRSAFEPISLFPRVFRGVAFRDTRTTVLGFDLAMPIIIAPVALIGMAYPDMRWRLVRRVRLDRSTCSARSRPYRSRESYKQLPAASGSSCMYIRTEGRLRPSSVASRRPGAQRSN